MSSCTVPDLMNAIDEAITTIQHLAELAQVFDEGESQYFPHAIELLSLIAREAAHVEKLSTQLARCVLPRPHALEGQS
jgi:hypothetical protein